MCADVLPLFYTADERYHALHIPPTGWQIQTHQHFNTDRDGGNVLTGPYHVILFCCTFVAFETFLVIL